MLTQSERKTILTADVKTRALVYCRVSTDEQAESGTSIEGQARAGADYAAKAGLEVVATFKEDYTGTTLDRPELNKAMAMLRAGQADAMIVYKPDRLDRSWMGHNTLIIMQALMSIGAELHYSETAHKVDFNNPMDVFMWGSLGGWQAGVDRDNTVKKLAKGRVDRAKQGFVVSLGGHIPYGYTRFKKDKRWYFEIDPEQAEIVKMIFNWYVYGDETGIGLSYGQIGDKLLSLGIQSPQGEKNWGLGSIGGILTNKTYTGTWHFGKKAMYESIPVNVPVIITPELFETATRLREFKNNRRNNKGTPLLLSSFARCPKCGYAMVKSGNRKSKHYYYRCARACSRERCIHRTYYNAGQIDDLVWAEIKALLTDPERRAAGVEAYRERQAGKATPYQAELQSVEAAIATAEKDLNERYQEFRDATGKGHRALLNIDIERMEGQLEALEARRDSLAQQITETAGTKEAAAELDKILANMAGAIDTISDDLQAKREFLRRLGLQAVIGTDEEGRQYIAITSKIYEKTISIDYSTTNYCWQRCWLR